MKTLNITPKMRTGLTGGKWFLAFVLMTTLFACQKELVTPLPEKMMATPTVTTLPFTVQNFQVNTTDLTLLQGNEQIKALGIQWKAAGNNTGVVYTLEAALTGNNTEDFIAIANTEMEGLDITVGAMNKMMCQLVPAGQTAMIDLRIRANAGNNAPVYGNAVALKVTTYLPYNEYDALNTLHVIGNFQNWVFGNATHLVNTQYDGIYEGFVNMDYQYPQFLMVRDEVWNLAHVFTNIGNGMFGFGGAYFNVKTGKGVYYLNANTNTNKWNLVKINTLGLYGTAVKNTTDPVMVADPENMVYTVQTYMENGNFRIRANNENNLKIGKTMVDGYQVPDVDGTDFTIEKAGYYTVTANLRLAGNYQITVTKTIPNNN